ncbi:MAG TPA: DUF4202 domain-containing protein [Rhizobiaceae bacterium]|nr:DUF4202 domain-containing protein [Rhizobiaceae bacterium]
MDERARQVIAMIDAANAADPQKIMIDGSAVPAALAYGRRMSDWLARLDPEAGVELAIACRAQHLERWTLPRSAYPMTKPGYHAWRNEQKRRHAERVGAMMRDAGFDDTAIARVGALVRKEGIKRDDEAQTLEDVACLVFLQHHAAEFAAGEAEEKVIDILRKTWRKMGPRGQEAALSAQLPPGVTALVKRALGEAPA